MKLDEATRILQQAKDILDNIKFPVSEYSRTEVVNCDFVGNSLLKTRFR